MRRRRQTETERGPEQVRGHARAGVRTRRRPAGIAGPDEVRDAARAPAHPPHHHRAPHRGQAGDGAGEAPPHLPPAGGPRVAPLDAAGARPAHRGSCRTEIELLWMTGELRLEKPTVPQEVYWGLHFFSETLFEAVPETAGEARPGRSRSSGRASAFDVSAVLPVRLLDRRRPGRQSLRHQRGHPPHPAREPGGEPAPLPAAAGGAAQDAEHHRAGGARCRRRSARRSSARSRRAATATGSSSRNPGEVFRQFLACMMRRLDGAVRACGAGTHRAGERGLRLSADELLADLRLLEQALREGGRRRPRATGWCGRCAARSRPSASAPCGSTCGRTPPGSPQALRALWRAAHRSAAASRPRSRVRRVEALAAGRAGPAPPGRRGRRRRCPADVQETLGMFRLVRGDARRAGPRGVRQLRAQHDARGGRRAGRLPAGQGGGPLRRRGGGRELHPADRARCSRPSRTCIARRPSCASCSASRWCAARVRALGGTQEVMIGYSDSQQGRRVPLLQLGAVQGAGPAHPAGRGAGRADRVLPRPRRLGEPGRRAARAGHRGAARRLHPGPDADHGAGRGGLAQVRQPRHGAVPGRAARRERHGALARVGARGGAGARQPSSTRRWRRCRAPPRRRTGASSSSPTCSPTSSAASPLEELTLLNIGSRPARRFGARIAGGPARHSLGVRLVAEPALRHRVVRASAAGSPPSSRCAASGARRCCSGCTATPACSA